MNELIKDSETTKTLRKQLTKQRMKWFILFLLTLIIGIIWFALWAIGHGEQESEYKTGLFGFIIALLIILILIFIWLLNNNARQMRKKLKISQQNDIENFKQTLNKPKA